MPSQRDRLENALRRAHTDTLHNTTIEVFAPTESFSQGDGYDVSYPDTPSATYDARVDSPSVTSDREASGTTSEADAVVFVRDDTGQNWQDFGDSGEAPTRLKDTADGKLYELEAVTDLHNGTLELEVTEV
jgi:hypothetical protein